MNINQKHKESLSALDKFALLMTQYVGTMGFFFLCNLIVLTPLIFPSTMSVVQYISSGWLQLVLLPILAVGQNLQGRHAELRAEEDFQTNVKAEKEIQEIKLQIAELELILKRS